MVELTQLDFRVIGGTHLFLGSAGRFPNSLFFCELSTTDQRSVVQQGVPFHFTQEQEIEVRLKVSFVDGDQLIPAWEEIYSPDSL